MFEKPYQIYIQPDKQLKRVIELLNQEHFIYRDEINWITERGIYHEATTREIRQLARKILDAWDDIAYRFADKSVKLAMWMEKNIIYFCEDLFYTPWEGSDGY